MFINPDDITIRTTLRSGDIGWVVHRHGVLYAQEYGYGIEFESYVAAGMDEFFRRYDSTRSKVWIAEHRGLIIGFVLVMDRGNDQAQLRYFYLEPEYRGKGVGSRLMSEAVDFLRKANYLHAYLWTTSELVDAAKLYAKFGFTLAEEKPSSSFGKDVVEQKYVWHKSA